MRFYIYCILYITTQLYSNLIYVSNTTYLCFVLAVLCSPVVSRVRLALLHTASLQFILILILSLMSSLASIPVLWIMEDKGGPTSGHKTKIHFCSVEAGTSGFTIFGKDVSG